MRVLCAAMTNEHSQANYILFDWDEDMQVFVHGIMDFIDAHREELGADFLHLTFSRCSAVLV